LGIAADREFIARQAPEVKHNKITKDEDKKQKPISIPSAGTKVDSEPLLIAPTSSPACSNTFVGRSAYLLGSPNFAITFFAFATFSGNKTTSFSLFNLLSIITSGTLLLFISVIVFIFQN